MKTFVWIAGAIATLFVAQAYCASEKKTEEKTQYLENIYFALSNGTSQQNVKRLVEFILSKHGINAEINVSM